MSSAVKTVSLETGMLAFSRSLQITEGLFFGTSSEKAELAVPIEVIEKGVRGQSSEDKAKNAGKSNPQSVESASVPVGCDGIELRYSVRVLDGAMSPHACDDGDVVACYRRLAKGYAKADGFKTLARLYLWNIANGRFAWRNRYQTDDAQVRLEFDGKELVFNPFVLDLEQPDSMEQLSSALIKGTADDLERFVEAFAAGFENGNFHFSVVWAAKMAAGQEVFPSQEYVREDKQRDDLSRVYAKLPAYHRGEFVQQASMHSQKIGAALRHIDIWHGNDEYGAIAVNPYGGVQETSDVLRAKKNSFYDLRKNAEGLLSAAESAQSESEITPELHFIMANLVRGGVYGKVGKK